MATIFYSFQDEEKGDIYMEEVKDRYDKIGVLSSVLKLNTYKLRGIWVARFKPLIPQIHWFFLVSWIGFFLFNQNGFWLSLILSGLFVFTGMIHYKPFYQLGLYLGARKEKLQIKFIVTEDALGEWFQWDKSKF